MKTWTDVVNQYNINKHPIKIKHQGNIYNAVIVRTLGLGNIASLYCSTIDNCFDFSKDAILRGLNGSTLLAD